MRKVFVCGWVISIALLLSGCTSQGKEETAVSDVTKEAVVTEAQQEKDENKTTITPAMIQESEANQDTAVQELPKMTASRVYPGVATIGTKLYVIGGDEGTANLTVEEYDPELDIWKVKSQFKETQKAFMTAVVNDKIYVIGGYGNNIKQSINLNQEYDPMTDTWTKKADMPTARQLSGIAVVNNKIYVIGGVNSSLEEGAYAFEVYDPQLDQWESLGRLDEMMTNPAVVALDDKIYTFGGTLGAGDMVDTVKAYDTKTGLWTTLKPLNMAMTDMTANVIDGLIYLIGGMKQDYTLSNEVNIYDPNTDSWSSGTSLPVARALHRSAQIDQRIYLVGGICGGSWDPTNTAASYYVNKNK